MRHGGGDGRRRARPLRRGWRCAADTRARGESHPHRPPSAERPGLRLRIPTETKAQLPAFAAARVPPGPWYPLNASAGRGFSPPHPPAFALENLWKFTEKPREFIDIYRIFQKFLIPEQADRLHHHTGIPRIHADGNYGELRGRAQVEDEAGLPGEGSPQSEPTPQVTPERLTTCYRNYGEMRSRLDGGRSLSP